MTQSEINLLKRLAANGRRVIHNNQIASCAIATGHFAYEAECLAIEQDLALAILEAEKLITDRRWTPETKQFPMLVGAEPKVK